MLDYKKVSGLGFSNPQAGFNGTPVAKASERISTRGRVVITADQRPVAAPLEAPHGTPGHTRWVDNSPKQAPARLASPSIS